MATWRWVIVSVLTFNFGVIAGWWVSAGMRREAERLDRAAGREVWRRNTEEGRWAGRS